jgi:hypothetical protein
MREMLCRDSDLQTMDAGINNVIYMELYLGPKMANDTCRKMSFVGLIDRGSALLFFGGWGSGVCVVSEDNRLMYFSF